MSQYLNSFESLANRVVGLHSPFLLSCFISSLSLDIRREVQALQPLTLLQAAALARLQEDKTQDSKRPFHSRNPPPLNIPPLNTVPAPPLPPLLPAPPKTTFKHLSPSEMVARREKGLCFNCDEKFSSDHRCKLKFFLIIADDEITQIPEEPPPPLSPEPPSIEISDVPSSLLN